MERVLFAVPRMIHPAVSGGETRVLGLLKPLAKRWAVTVATFAEPGAEKEAAAAALDLETRTGIKTLLVPRTPGAAARASASLPEIARSHFDPAMEEALVRAARDADVAVLEFTQMLQYARPLAQVVPVVGVEHDAGILSAERSYLRGAGDDESRRAADYLRRELAACRLVVALSEEDARLLAPLAGGSPVRVVPSGVDLAALPFKDAKGRDRRSVVFVGHYPHFPNEDAAVRLAKEVMPALRARVPGARLTLVGSRPTPVVRGLASADVTVTGTVHSVRPFLDEAGVFVAPLRLGRGLKGKVLEAFASGVPMAGTRVAFEGIPGADDGTTALVADGAEPLAAAAARLLTDVALSDRLSRAARALVEERYTCERQSGILDSVLREALGARA